MSPLPAFFALSVAVLSLYVLKNVFFLEDKALSVAASFFATSVLVFPHASVAASQTSYPGCFGERGWDVTKELGGICTCAWAERA